MSKHLFLVGIAMCVEAYTQKDWIYWRKKKVEEKKFEFPAKMESGLTILIRSELLFDASFETNPTFLSAETF